MFTFYVCGSSRTIAHIELARKSVDLSAIAKNVDSVVYDIGILQFLESPHSVLLRARNSSSPYRVPIDIPKH